MCFKVSNQELRIILSNESLRFKHFSSSNFLCHCLKKKNVNSTKLMGYFSIPVHQFFPICFAQCFDCIIPVFNSLLRMFVSSSFHPCPLLNYALCQMTVWQKPPNLGDSEKMHSILTHTLFNWIIEKKVLFSNGVLLSK